MKRKFVVRNSQISGKGIFAAMPIKKGSFIFRVVGEEVSIPELKRRYEAGDESVTDPLQVRTSKYLDIHKPFVFFNHSCEPNTAIIGYAQVVAIRNIQKGEEITFDYSLTEWSDRRNWSGYDAWVMPCTCGASTCRKQIGEFRYLPKKLQHSAVVEHRVQNHILKKYPKRIWTNP